MESWRCNCQSRSLWDYLSQPGTMSSICWKQSPLLLTHFLHLLQLVSLLCIQVPASLQLPLDILLQRMSLSLSTSCNRKLPALLDSEKIQMMMAIELTDRHNILGLDPQQIEKWSPFWNLASTVDSDHQVCTAVNILSVRASLHVDPSVHHLRVSPCMNIDPIWAFPDYEISQVNQVENQQGKHQIPVEEL